MTKTDRAAYVQQQIERHTRQLITVAAEGDVRNVERLEDALADLLDEQSGVGVVAPCGVEFLTNGDASTHAATCGACAGADDNESHHGSAVSL